MQRRSVVEIYENGLSYKKRSALWNEIESVNDCAINIRDEKPIVLPRTINGIDHLLASITQHIA
jgi:hypothetical protein